MDTPVRKRDWVYTDASKPDNDSIVMEHIGAKAEIKSCYLMNEDGSKTTSYIARRIDDTLSVKDNPFVKLCADNLESAEAEVRKYLEYRRDHVQKIVPTNRAITENGLTVIANWSIASDCFVGEVVYEGNTQTFWGKTWDDFTYYFRIAATELGVPGFGADERGLEVDLIGSPPSDPELVARILNCHRSPKSDWEPCKEDISEGAAMVPKGAIRDEV